MALAAALAASFAVRPTPATAQGSGVRSEFGVVLARRMDRDDGPALGKVGVEARVFGSGGSPWGVALGYHPLGRFRDPADHFDESVVTLGPRRRFGVGASGRASATLGADVAVVAQEDPSSGVARDPALGGFAGFGLDLNPGAEGPDFFLEAGVHGILATGELTNGSGGYATIVLAVVF